MRTIPVGLAAKYAAGTHRLAQCVRLERTDGYVVGLTSASRDVPVNGVTYLCDPGMSPTSLSQSSGLAVSNLEATFLPEDTYITQRDVLAGLWANAEWTLFELDPDDVAAGIDILMFGQFGDITMAETGIRAELRSVTQLLQQMIGDFTSKTCRVPLFSQGLGFCNVDPVPWTHTGTLTSVTNRSVITDTGRGEAADYFGEGLLTMTSGACTGMRVSVRQFLAGGQFTLSTPLLSTPAAGDTYLAQAGCHKRREDCRDKFNNIFNMQAEPDLPGTDYLSKPGDVTNG